MDTLLPILWSLCLKKLDFQHTVRFSKISKKQQGFHLLNISKKLKEKLLNRTLIVELCVLCVQEKDEEEITDEEMKDEEIKDLKIRDNFCN